jgi:hypothetical protein
MGQNVIRAKKMPSRIAMKKKVPCLCLRNSWNPEMGYLNKQL